MSEIVFKRDGWPEVFELDPRETHVVARELHGTVFRRTVTLVGVDHIWQPDYWVEDNASRRALSEARVTVEVDGEPHVMYARPYQMPVSFAGLQLYVEATATWAVDCTYAPLEGMRRAVRFSAVLAGESWGPESIRFPIEDYHWRSSTYNNTWLSLVPYNHLYYHRGEDYGAIPDRLPVRSPVDGVVAESPLPHGDGASNAVTVDDGGLRVRMAHMNVETIRPEVAVGTRVRAGDILGKTGSTWSGRKSQYRDPHLHVGLHWGQTVLSPYPFLVEAYLRTYPDPVLPVAGGYHFSLPGRPVRLDATRTIARDGREIDEYLWTLSDGRRVSGPVTEVVYERPGLYSVRLTVRTADGEEDEDFAQIRVFDPERGSDMVWGWAHHSPVRGVLAGTPVLFWNRIANTTTAVHIDFGDGSSSEVIEEQLQHVYVDPGRYVVTLTSSGPGDEPATLQMRVVVAAPEDHNR